MNKPHPEDPDIMIEYDLSSMERSPNQFAKYFPEGRVVSVVLDPDVAERFPDSAAVNKALRALGQLADEFPVKKARRRGSKVA
jgi:hypothetical protein